MSNVMAKRQAAIRNKADEIYEELETYNRKPFMELLSQALSAAPSHKDLLALSQKSPDRYGQYIAVLARLSGYTEQTMVQLGLVQMLPTLPEAERALLLEQKLKEREQLLLEQQEPQEDIVVEAS